jgi:hypothetical protein
MKINKHKEDKVSKSKEMVADNFSLLELRIIMK